MNQDKYFNGIRACSCDRRYAPVYVREHGQSYVRCKSCDRYGPFRDNKESAIDAWNKGEKV